MSRQPSGRAGKTSLPSSTRSVSASTSSPGPTSTVQSQARQADEEINLGGGIKIATDKKQLTIIAPDQSGKIVDVFAGKEYLFTATVNETGEIHLAKNSSIAQEMIRRYTNNENIRLRPV
jgi:ATPase